MITLWLEAFKAVLSDELGGGEFEDAIIYPRGGMLYKSWVKINDFDLTFYFNDWVYQIYQLKNKDFPYRKIANAFMKSAEEKGLSISEGCYAKEDLRVSMEHDNFSKFPLTIEAKNGAAIRFHIFDAMLSMISPNSIT